MVQTTISERIAACCANSDAGVLPKAVKLELTTRCNHNCSYCMNPKMKRHADMPCEVFMCALEDIVKFNIPEVGMFHIGESTLHPRLVAWHKLVKNMSPSTKTFLTTNGTMLKPLLELMRDGLDSLKFSLNGWDRKSQKVLVGFDDFDLVQDNIKTVLQERKLNCWKTQVSGSALLSSNCSEQMKFKEDMEKLLDCFYMTEVFTQAGNIHPKAAGSSNVLKTHEFPCYAPFNMLYIMPDGAMSICKYGRSEEFIIGNILDMHINEAWNSEKAEEVRKLHLAHKLAKCEICMSEIGAT